MEQGCESNKRKADENWQSGRESPSSVSSVAASEAASDDESPPEVLRLQSLKGAAQAVREADLGVVKYIDMDAMDFTNADDKYKKDALRLREAFRKGVWPAVTDIDLNRTSDPDILKAVFTSVLEDRFPVLQDLRCSLYNYDELDPYYTEANLLLAEAIELGKLPRLRCLDLNRTRIGDVVATRILKALGENKCSELIELDLEETKMGDGAGAALVHAMRNGALVKLQMLKIGHNTDVSHDVVAQILQALRDGACPDLEEFHVESDIDPPLLEALAEAMSAGKLSKLQVLDIETYYTRAMDGPALEVFAKALRDGCCPLLRDLNLVDYKITSDSWQLLADALSSGGCRKLRNLTLNDWSKEKDDIVSGIKQGVSQDFCIDWQ